MEIAAERREINVSQGNVDAGGLIPNSRSSDRETRASAFGSSSDGSSTEDYINDAPGVWDPWSPPPALESRPPTSNSWNQPGPGSDTWIQQEGHFRDSSTIYPTYETVEPQPNPYLLPRPLIYEASQASFADESRTQRQAARLNAPLTSGLLALLASLFFGPLGLWLGIRSCRSRRGISISAILAIFIGGISTFFLALSVLSQFQ